jgi:hypothetical protein
MSPPPGNNGGAVSGAGPCALIVEAQSYTTNDSDAHFLQASQNALRNLTAFPPAKIVIPEYTYP